MKLIIMWLCVMGVAMLIEMFTSSYLTVWFAVGAGFAAVIAALGLGWYFQIPVFLIISLILLFLVRDYFVVYMETGKFEMISPEQRMIGKQAVLTEDVSTESGKVFIDGKIMSAKVNEGTEALTKGTVVEVTGVAEGILLVEEATKVKEDHSLTKSAARKERRRLRRKNAEPVAPETEEA